MAKQESESYVVSGRITSSTDQPVEGLIVRAFDVDHTMAEDFASVRVFTNRNEKLKKD